LYGLPVAINKVQDLAELRAELGKYGGELRLFVDHLDQVKFLQAYYETQQITGKPWSVFVKINGGQK
jgi:D-serine ammonia-lyase